MNDDLNFLVDKKTLSYVVPFYFSITLSVIYLIISYILVIINHYFGYIIMLSDNIIQSIQQNFYTIFLIIWISVWLYFILKLWYKSWKYIFNKYIKDNDLTKIKSFFIFLYWTWLYCSLIFISSTIWVFFDFYYFGWSLFSTPMLYFIATIIWLSFIFCLIELVMFEDNNKLRNLSLSTVWLMISFILIFWFLLFSLVISVFWWM